MCSYHAAVKNLFFIYTPPHFMHFHCPHQPMLQRSRPSASQLDSPTVQCHPPADTSSELVVVSC